MDDARWDGLIVCLAVYIATAVGRFHELFPWLDVVRPALVAALFAIVLAAVDGARIRRAALLWTGPTKWLVALLAWMVVAIPLALVVGSSVDLVADFAKTFVMCLVIAASVRGARDLERLTGMYLFAAATYAAVVVARFDTGSGDDWRLGHLYTYDANDFATYAVTAVPFGVYFAGRRWGGAVRIGALAALTIASAAFVRSGSRGGFLALLAVVVFMLLRYTGIPARTRALAVVVAAVVILGAASDRYWEQMGTILSDTDYNHTDETGRLQIWGRGIGYMLGSPLFGVGPGNFGAAEGLISDLAERQAFGVGVRWSAPHNSFVQAGAELGIPGLLLFAGVIASAFNALGRLRQRTEDPRDRAGVPPELAKAVTASLIGFTVGACFLSLAYADMLYVLIGLALAIRKLDESRA
jgi:O-antigen ligase